MTHFGFDRNLSPNNILTASFLSHHPHVESVSSDDQPLALVVAGNATVEGRLRSILKNQGWNTETCGDGDKAVDEFVNLRPKLVFLSLDIPSMDGHLAALEMRESDYDARIVFVSSRQRMTTARNAAYSAGAVAVLETPLTQSVFDENWDSMMGEIPPAPGLADLDELYPESDEPELPPLPMPPIMPAMPEAVVMPDIQPEIPEPIKKPKKKGKWLKRILVLLILAGSGAVIAHYFDMIDLTEYLPMLEEYLP